MRATCKTELGEFEIELSIAEAPITAGYFRDFITSGNLDGSSFYRIVTRDNATLRAENPIQVIQGGLKEKDAQTIPPIEHEPTSQTGLTHAKWTLSTSRHCPGETFGSFFICMRDEPELDCGGKRHPDGLGFAAFGRVVSGFDVIEQIFARGEASEYLEVPVIINSFRIKSDK